MSTAPARWTEPGALAQLVGPTLAYAKVAKSEATQMAYRRDWQAFEAWGQAHGTQTMPATPETLALYLTDLADNGRKVAGISRALASISQAHKAAGYASPRSTASVQAVMRGIRRKLGVAQVQKAPVLVADLRRMASSLSSTLKGTRDRALLLLGFAGAFRRSELVGLDVTDLAFDDEGLTVTLRRSKTDQEGAGRKVGIPYGGDQATCPVGAVKAWLAAAGAKLGPVFVGVNRHGKLTGQRLAGEDVARIVKAVANTVGLDSATFSGHSLRAGLVTSAAKAGKSERAIMAQTGHRSVTMVRRYIRDTNLFTENAAAGIGL